MGILLIVIGIFITIAGVIVHAKALSEQQRLAALHAERQSWGKSIESGTFNTAYGKCALGNEHLRDDDCARGATHNDLRPHVTNPASSSH